MVIAHGKDVKIGIFDIECLRGMFHIGIYNPDEDSWLDFEISKYRNDLFAFVKWYTKNDFDFLVSFNGVGYDHQVLEYIIRNHQKWFDNTGVEIASILADFSTLIIDNGKYGIQPPFREHEFSVKAIDLFKIHHMDNEAKMTSLKWCEFMMNMDVEEMPIHHTQEHLTEEECQMIRDYEKNDILATLCLFYITLGDLQKAEELLEKMFGFSIKLDELEDYKGKNKIQDRFDVNRETLLNCMNWSDVKIGEEWNKSDYKIAENIKDDSVLFSKKIKHPYGQPFKNFFPKTMEFKTEKLKKFIEMLGNEPVKAAKKGKKAQEFKIKIGETIYTIAKGGIHSTEKNRRIIPQEGWILRDADVGSQYPNSIVKLCIYAPHLKDTILRQYNEKIDKRIRYKKKGNELKEQGLKEEARQYIGIQEMLKLCLNGGYYGKLGQPGSFLEYPEGLLKVCMGNQIEILMIIEAMELEGIQVVSGNTDGFVCYFPKEKEETYKRICKEWEEKVGNTVMGKLEYTDFVALYQDDINSYIGRKIEIKKGEVTYSVKKKGRFLTTQELNKNKSRRIIALAMEAYLIDGKNPVDFIKNHKNIFDFCIAKKASGKMHYEEITGTETKVHKKLVRYFISENGSVLMKRGFDFEGKPVNNHCEAIDKDYPWFGQPSVCYFNRYYKSDNYHINYNYYIMEVLKKIDAICKTKMAKNYADQFKQVKQISLW